MIHFCGKTDGKTGIVLTVVLPNMSEQIGPNGATGYTDTSGIPRRPTGFCHLDDALFPPVVDIAFALGHGDPFAQQDGGNQQQQDHPFCDNAARHTKHSDSVQDDDPKQHPAYSSLQHW